MSPSGHFGDGFERARLDIVREARRSAVRNMIAYLVAEHGLDRVEAYMLCSVVGDLKMHEAVRRRVFFDPCTRRLMITKFHGRWTCRFNYVMSYVFRDRSSLCT